jgi:CRISPR-associated protein Cas1
VPEKGGLAMGLAWAVTEQGSSLRVDSGALECWKEEKRLASVPLVNVDRIDCFGAVMLTPRALDRALDEGVAICFYSSTGSFRGRLDPRGEGAELRRVQSRALDDPAFCAALRERLLLSRWEGLERQAVRWAKGRARVQPGDFRDALARGRALLSAAAGDLPRLRALEGQVQRTHFDLLRAAAGHHPWFGPRSKRPPLDPGNALLSFGYACLCGWLTSALWAEGLEPAWGFYHVGEGLRPSLALDLMEPLRVHVDRLALVLARRRQMGERDFAPRDGGVFLSDQGRKKYLCHLLEIFGPATGGARAVAQSASTFKALLKSWSR